MRDVCAVVISVAVRGYVMRDVFMHWSNMFAWFVPWTISSRWHRRVVWRVAFVVSGSVSFVGFPACGSFEKSLFAPKRHRHQSRHVKRSTGCGDCADDPDYPANRNVPGAAAFQRISSFDQKPLNGMMPQIASHPARNVKYV